MLLLVLIGDILSPGGSWYWRRGRGVQRAACPVASAPGFLQLYHARRARLGVGERLRSFGRIFARATRLSPPRAGKCTLTLGHL